MPKSYRCLTSFVPFFSCQNRTDVQPLSYLIFYAHSQLYGLFHTTQKQQTENRNLHRNSCPKILGFRAKFIRLYESVQYGLPQQKKISTKNSQKNFLGNCAHFPRKMCPLCCSLFSLKHAQKISLTLLPMCSQHPPDVFTTCLAHYPMHSFII
jgi:hypothetical protein